MPKAEEARVNSKMKETYLAWKKRRLSKCYFPKKEYLLFFMIKLSLPILQVRVKEWLDRWEALRKPKSHMEWAKEATACFNLTTMDNLLVINNHSIKTRMMKKKVT